MKETSVRSEIENDILNEKECDKNYHKNQLNQMSRDGIFSIRKPQNVNSPNCIVCSFQFLFVLCVPVCSQLRLLAFTQFLYQSIDRVCERLATLLSYSFQFQLIC